MLNKYILIVFSIFLMSCSNNQTSRVLTDTPMAVINATLTSEASTPAPQKSETISPTVTKYPIKIPTLTATTLPEIMNYECLDVITNGLPPSVARNGVMVVNSDGNEGAWLIGFPKGSMPVQLPWIGPEREEEEHISGFDVSPDKTKLLYDHSNQVNPGNLEAQLVIVTADGNQILTKSIDPGDTWHWFDNERIYNWGRSVSGQFEMVLLNYKTGETQEIIADYPGYSDVFSNSFMLSYSPFASFDNSLSRAIYPACDPDCIPGFPVIMRDVTTGKTLAKLVTSDLFGLKPIWLSDFSQFIIGANVEPSDNVTHAKEIYLVDRNGEFRQLTHFSESFAEVELPPYYSLSPDGRYLAFWIKAKPSIFEDDRLAILDIKTGDVTNYCLPGETFRNDPGSAKSGYETDFGDPPVWSPDSTQLLVVGRDPNNRETRWNILVDLKNKVAIKEGEDIQAVGWMVTP